MVVPVTDVDRAKDFSTGIVFREDGELSGPGGFRVVHLTPPGSTASINMGTGVTGAAPARPRVSEVLHDAGGRRAHGAGRGPRHLS
ncbi:hypothetical protein GCM10010412_085110 [Nonomuraea recticatena]|uniref:Uncharacterized protein n=1 Tax=Nonomuraea recticatena TaxID=46178 RepID=A0ABP6FKJ6_9ACTN